MSDRSLETESDTVVETLLERLTTLEQHAHQLTDRVDELETDLERTQTILEHTRGNLDATCQTLESRTQTLEATTQRVEDLESENERLRGRLEACEHENTQTSALAEATRKRSATNKRRIEELQARELEKGAHLLAECVDLTEIDVATDRLERITKDDGKQYFRLPEHEDPLERGGSIQLAHGDLLPIQQLARMDDEMLRSTTNALPTRLAAKLWKARTDSSVGDNPWMKGCKSIKEYVKASDLKHWIRRQERGVSDAYAKKLVSRTIDAILDLSNNRVAIRKRRERKNGLEYTERRLIIPTDAEIPGETGSSSPQPPETADVLG